MNKHHKTRVYQAGLPLQLGSKTAKPKHDTQLYTQLAGKLLLLLCIVSNQTIAANTQSTASANKPIEPHLEDSRYSNTDTETALAYVDPMIGTDGTGHTFPGAAYPFGMIQLSPSDDTAEWKFCSGYHYSANTIKGFAHNHYSGAGLAGLGDILIMPASTATTQAGTQDNPDSGYRSHFSHERETAKAAYYSVYLDDAKAKAELTATQYGGYHRYTFDADTGQFIIIDPTHGINEAAYETQIEIVSPYEIRGYKKVFGYSAGDRTVYFVATFSQPFKAKLTSNDTPVEASALRDYAVKASLAFNVDAAEPIEVKVALSHVSAEGALKNYQAKVAPYQFDTAQQLAQQAWAKVLNKIAISSTSTEQKRTFYTAMYHAFLSPNLISDVDGHYYLEGKVRHSTIEQYSNYSTWDTYRSLHPLWNVLDHHNNAKFINSLVSRHSEQGLILPAWEGHGFDNRTMIGYPTVSAIADAILRGVDGIDTNKAYNAIRATAFDTTKHSNVYDRNGMATYLTYGFVSGETGSSVSKTTEQNYMDWTIARVAEKLSLTQDRDLFDQRSLGYRHYYHNDDRYLMPRLSTGEHVDVSLNQWAPLIHNYISGNIWAYSSYTPHDMAGAISLQGGVEQYETFLDGIFTETAPIEGHQHPDISGFIGRYAHGDEPGHQMPYLYNLVGSPWKTQLYVNQILTTMYNDTPNGLVNNEDLGQMSAWYIFGSLGLYPVNPGDGIYQLGAPLHEQAEIRLENGNHFRVIAENLSADNIYVQSVLLNGEAHALSYINHETLMAGGSLRFFMGPKPNKQFAAKAYEQSALALQNAAKPMPSLPPFAPKIIADSRLFADNVEVSLQPDKSEHTVYYTLNGSTPTQQSTVASTPLRLNKDTLLRAVSIDAYGNRSSISEQTFFQSAIAPSAKPRMHLQGNMDFGDSEGSLLLDGKLGSFAYSDGRWTGKRDTLEVFVDLGKRAPIATVNVGTLVDAVNGIFPAKSVKVYGKNRFGRETLLGRQALNWQPALENKRLAIDVKINPKHKAFRRYRVEIEPWGDMPVWRTSNKSQGLLLVDEVQFKPALAD